MSTTRKIYVQTAAIIAEAIDDAVSDEPTRKALISVANELAEMFKRDNGAFRYSVFFDACRLPVPDKHLGSR